MSEEPPVTLLPAVFATLIIVPFILTNPIPAAVLTLLLANHWVKRDRARH